jgi:hypothetical protein
MAVSVSEMAVDFYSRWRHVGPYLSSPLRYFDAMNNIKKPSWLIYAEQVDSLKPKKSGKNVEAKLLWSLKTAIDEHKYPGSFNDWQVLIQRLGRR